MSDDQQSWPILSANFSVADKSWPTLSIV